MQIKRLRTALGPMSFMTLLLFTPVKSVASTSFLDVKAEVAYERETKRVTFKSSAAINPNVKDWTTLGRGNQGMLLLGKVTQQPGERFQVEYLLLDTSTAADVVSNSGVLTGVLGKKKGIATASFPAKVSISLSVEKSKEAQPYTYPEAESSP